MATSNEMQRAHRLVAEAIKSGDLIRQPCEVCGDDGDVEAHHADYGRPLDVQWLCPKHHKQWHRDNGHILDKGTVLNIRKFPDELARTLKIEAASRGITLRELVIEKCSGDSEVREAKQVEPGPKGGKGTSGAVAAKPAKVLRKGKRVPARKSVGRGSGGETEPATPTNSGAVAASSVYQGPEHMKGCGCNACRIKRGEI